MLDFFFFEGAFAHFLWVIIINCFHIQLIVLANCKGLFFFVWCIGLGCLLRWWARIFLSKGVGTGPIVTQLGPVCAQTYALFARSKLTTSSTVTDELRQTDIIIITKTEYSNYLNKWLCNPQSTITIMIMSFAQRKVKEKENNIN